MTPMEMARKAINYLPETDYEPILYTKEQIERFADLASRQAYLDGVNSGIEAEREACARVCADLWCKEPEPGDARDCYDAIRARGKK